MTNTRGLKAISGIGFSKSWLLLGNWLHLDFLCKFHYLEANDNEAQMTSINMIQKDDQIMTKFP